MEITTRKSLIVMVPTEGVEPTHPHGYQILSLARLPIPPHRPPIKSMHSSDSSLSIFPLHPAIAPRRFCLCKPYRIISRVHGNARIACQKMASGARFRKCRICFNTLSAEITLGKLKFTGKQFGRVCKLQSGPPHTCG